jgi:hypothetical protein
LSQPLRYGAERFSREDLLAFAIFCAGFLLRLYHYDTVPQYCATRDEFAWTWSGISLLHEGLPRAWSLLPSYGPTKYVDVHGQGFALVQPFLDHPPLFSVVMGLWMWLGGVKQMFDAELHYMRISSLLFFVGNFWMVWRLLPRFFERTTVLVALVYFAVSPLAVVQQRLVISENCILFTYLVTHYCLIRFDETRRRRYLAGVAAGAVALPLIKVAAVCYSVYFTVVSRLRRNWTLTLTVAAGTLVGLAAWVVYGTRIDAHLFFSLMGDQRARWNGFWGFYQLLFNPKIVESAFPYTPFILASLLIFQQLGNPRTREFYLQYPIFIALMTLMVDQHNVYGWYLMPMYPVLSAAVAQFLVRLFSDESATFALTWAVAVFPYVGLMLLNAGNGPVLRYGYGLAVLAMFGVLTLAPGQRLRPARVVGGLLVAAQLMTDVWSVIIRDS